MKFETKQLRRVFVCGFFFFATSMVNGQVMYNLRGGIMPGTVHTDMEHDEDATESRIDWMIGFELEIPIAKNWNIETGLRYKQKSFVAYKDYDFGSYWYNEDYLAKHPEEDFNKRLYHTYLNASILELPIRATYKFHLNDNFSFHLGFGPYASFNLTGKPFDAGMPFESSALSVGIEPSVALYYKNVSIGAIYNNPIFFQRHKELDSNRFMITVGFRFGNKVWNSIGRGLSKAEESGALDALANAFTQTGEALGGNTTPAIVDTNSSSYSESQNDVGSNMNYLTQYQNWERRAQANYNSLVNLGYSAKDKKGNRTGGTGQRVSPSNYTQMNKSLREAQKEMRNIRLKAAKAGVTIQESKWETATVNY